jgi:alginate O-acetyltransferase complex protein AlgI
MGGNRCSKPRAYFNQFSTMVIGGLWHGASWMYVIWGAIHGFLLVAHKSLKRLFPNLTVDSNVSWWRMTLNIFLTFNLVAIAFVFFRMRSLEGAAEMAHQIIYDFHPAIAPQFIIGYFTIILALMLGYFMHFMPHRWFTNARDRFIATPFWVQALVLALVILLIIQVRQSDLVPFIYLQY